MLNDMTLSFIQFHESVGKRQAMEHGRETWKSFSLPLDYDVKEITFFKQDEDHIQTDLEGGTRKIGQDLTRSLSLLLEAET